MMVKSLIFAFLLFFATTRTSAQTNVREEVRTLYERLSKSRPDTARVNLLINISRFNYANSAQQPSFLDSVIARSSRAKVLAEQLGYGEGIGLSYQLMAQAFCGKGDFKKANMLINNAIGVFLRHKLYRDAAEAYLNVEQFYTASGGNDYHIRINAYEKARPLFNKAQAFDREGATLSILGDFYQITGDFNTSLDRLHLAIAAHKKTKYRYLQYLYDLLGAVYLQKGYYNEALKYGLLAEKTAVALKDSSLMLCTIYTRLGVTYAYINKPDQGRICLQKALEIAQRHNDPGAINIVSNKLIDVLANDKKPAEALALLKNLQQKFPHPDSGAIRYNLGTLVGLYSDLKNYPMAQRYADELLKTSVLSRGSESTIHALDALTSFFIDSKQYENVAKYVPQYLQIALKQGKKRDEIRAYLRTFKSDSARHDYSSAINNLKKYFVLQDSLYDVTKVGQLEELKIKYETEQKQKSITTLEINNKHQQESLQRADKIRNIIIGGSLILLVFLMLLLHSYRLNNQKGNAIAKKNLELGELITEREWLLKEIHHRVKNNLQIVTGLLQRQSAYVDNEQALAAIQNSENRMHAIALIHQKLYQSENLDLISMPEYIEELVGFLKESSGVDNRLTFEKHLENIRLDVAQAVPLGLILNEAITNAIKYAYDADETGTIYITLICNEGQSNQLIIADDGPGLPPELNVEQIDSLGLNLMRGLVKQLGGSFEISNEQGCTINITFKTEIFNKAVERG